MPTGQSDEGILSIKIPSSCQVCLSRQQQQQQQQNKQAITTTATTTKAQQGQYIYVSVLCDRWRLSISTYLSAILVGITLFDLLVQVKFTLDWGEANYKLQGHKENNL